MSKGFLFVLGTAGAFGMSEVLEITKVVPGASVQSALLVWLLLQVGDVKRRVKALEERK